MVNNESTQNDVFEALVKGLPPVVSLRQLETLSDGLFKFNTLKSKSYPDDVYMYYGRTRVFVTEKLLKFILN